MELIEGEHFKKSKTEEKAINLAIRSFIDIINTLANAGDLEDWVQVKVIEEIS
jgi:hypothetical protein